MSAEGTGRGIVIGTRGSALALRQTDLIVQMIRGLAPEIGIRIERIETAADRHPQQPMSALGDKGVWVRSIERALLDGRIDIAVHSLKDVPSDGDTPGLTLAAFSARADPRDCLVSRDGLRLERLGERAVVGTSSLRRAMLLRGLRPDLEIRPIRGNVDTRLRKLREGQYDAVVLAAAGLERLGLTGEITHYLPADTFVPDAGQGIMAVQVRAGDEALVRGLDDETSRAAALAERAAVRALGADCRSPVGVHATFSSDGMLLRGVAARDASSPVKRTEERGPVRQGGEIGRRLGERLLEMIGPQGAC